MPSPREFAKRRLDACPFEVLRTVGWFGEVDQLESLKEGLDRPGALDDATVTRVQRVYGEQLDDLWVFQEQIRRWDSEPLTDTQQVTVTRLGAELAGMRVTLT
jgi:hypothetical protein